MTLSLPSAFAAVTSADIPPTSAADFAEAALTVDVLFEEPHAATSTRAVTATARPRIRYRQLIHLSPNDGWPTPVAGAAATSGGVHDAPATATLQREERTPTGGVALSEG